MSTHENRLGPRPSGDRPNMFEELRRHNKRRAEAARILQSRRLRQIERVLQLAREHRSRGPR